MGQGQWKAGAPVWGGRARGWMARTASEQWVMLVSLHHYILMDRQIRDLYELFPDLKLLIHARVPLFYFVSTNSVKC